MSALDSEHRPMGVPKGFQKLDVLERAFACMNHRGALQVCCTLIVETEVQLSVQVFRRAAWLWTRNHPRLRARILTEDANYRDAWFTEMPSLAEEDMPVQEVDHSNWRSVHETELGERFDCDVGPLWRLKYVPCITDTLDGARHGGQGTEPGKDTLHSALVFAFHHSICDDIGLTTLIGEYIDIVICLQHGRHPPKIMEPVCESICDMVAGLSYLEWLGLWLLSMPLPGFSHALQWFIQNNLHIWTHNVPLLPVSKREGVLHRTNSIVFSEVETAALVKTCREGGFTVQGALQAAIGKALAQLRPGGHVTDEDSFDVQYNVPVNIRPLLQSTPIPNTVIGNFIQPIYPHKTFSSAMNREHLHNAAFEMSRDIKKTLKSMGSNWQLRYLLGPEGFWDGYMKCTDELTDYISIHGWNSNVMLSNFGVCDSLYKNDPLVRTKSTIWSLSMNNYVSVFTLMCITVKQQLYATLTTQRNVVSEELATAVTKAFHEAMLTCIE